MRSAIGLWLVTLLCVFSPLSSGEEGAKDERVAVHGKVVGADGEPVPGIAVRGTTYDDITEATSDAEGKFVLKVLEARRTQLQIVAVDPEGERLGLVRGYSRESQQSEPVVKLSPCKSLAFEVIDAEGNVAAGVSIGSIADYSRVLDVVTDPDGKATLRVPEWGDIHLLFAYSPELGFDYKVVTTPRDKTWQAKWLEDKPIRMQLARNQTVKLQLTEATDEPIADMKVSLWLLYKPGEPDAFNLGSLPEAFRATTDKNGVATFSVPDWNVHPLTFWPDSSDLTYVRQRMTFDPEKHPDNVVQVVLDRLVPISGQVKVRDGEPTANVAVSIVGAGYEDNFQEQVKTDSEGRYRMMVPPHLLYAIGVESREWGAPLVEGVIVKPNEPLKNLDLELRPATRIHGQLTMGPGKEPVTGERVVLNQGARDLHNTPGLELPNPENSRRWVEPNFFRQGMTDELGHFEFFVGPGKYTLSGPSQVDSYKFEVVDEREVRYDFNAPRPERGPFAGMVVTGDPPRPVPDALVDGIYRAHVDPEFRARTDAEGRFADERALHRVVLRAKSDDGKLAGIIEIGPDETDVTISIAPVGSATARLVDATSGDALPATEIRWGRRVHIGDDDAPWQTAWGGYVTTDDEGRFTLEGLVVGQEYDLSVPRGDGSYGSLPEFVCESAECVDLGDLKLEPPYVPPTFEERVAEQLAATRSPDQRYDRALEEAVRLRQHVAVVFLQPGEPVTDSWFRLRLEDREVRNALPDYQLIQLDSKNEQAQELAERLELELDGSSPQWVIASATGEVLATGAVPLEADGSKIDRAALLERLAHHAPEPLDAHEVLKTALADAAATNRRVIVQETATWCGPCHMLARFLEKHRGVWEKDYVWIRIDHRWKGSQEAMDSLEAEDRGGIPWCAILDAEGKVLATSNAPDGNIGFPSEPKGIEHFASMLNTTRQRMTERDVDELCNELKGE